MKLLYQGSLKPKKSTAGLTILGLLALFLSGCASNMQQQQIEKQPDSALVLPFKEPAAPVDELDGDILFHYLVAEVAAQRGEFQLAYNHYLHAALLAGDGYAAKRAAQIAVFLKDQAATEKAANRWVKISPNSIQARNTAAIVNFRAGNRKAALDNMQALVDIANVRNRDGFLILAVSLAKEKQAESALKLYETFMASHQQNAKALYAYAFLLTAHQKYGQVIEVLQKSISLDTDWVKPKLLMVRVLIEHKGPAEAIEYLESVLPQHADSTDLRLVYAKMLVSEDKRKAYEQFEIILDANPSSEDVIAALGVLAVQLEDLSLAKKWWRRLLEIGDRENRSEAAFQLGQLEELGGDKRTAEKFYLMVKDGKYKIDARIRLARIQAELGNIDSARDVLKQLRVLEPEHLVEYYLTEAQILHEHAPQEEVFALYETALATKPGDLELIYSRGIYAADQGLIAAAERDFRAILEKSPDDADALNALGYTLANQTDRYAEAYKLIKRAFALKPDNAAILDSMGWVYYRLGNLENAEKFLQQALAKQNDDEIAAHLGEVLWMMGKRVQARSIWTKALDDFPDSKMLAEVLGRFK